MHSLIRYVLQALSREKRIPSDVLLIGFDCRPNPLLSESPSASELSIQARRDGSSTLETTLTFFLPRIPKPLKKSFSPQGHGKSFSPFDIYTYLQLSGDDNPIHKGDFPIVPGLLIANWLLTTHFSEFTQFKMRFKHPLFCNQTVLLEETGDYFTLFHHQTPILEVHV